jgi:hypothetical protein
MDHARWGGCSGDVLVVYPGRWSFPRLANIQNGDSGANGACFRQGFGAPGRAGLSVRSVLSGARAMDVDLNSNAFVAMGRGLSSLIGGPATVRGPQGSTECMREGGPRGPPLSGIWTVHFGPVGNLLCGASSCLKPSTESNTGSRHTPPTHRQAIGQDYEGTRLVRQSPPAVRGGLAGRVVDCIGERPRAAFDHRTRERYSDLSIVRACNL